MLFISFTVWMPLSFQHWGCPLQIVSAQVLHLATGKGFCILRSNFFVISAILRSESSSHEGHRGQEIKCKLRGQGLFKCGLIK